MKIFFQNMLNEVLKVVKNWLFQKKSKRGGGGGREVEDMKFLVVYIEQKEHLEIPGVN